MYKLYKINYVVKLSFLLLFVFFDLLHAQTFQNLVPNGSFETYTNCPFIDGQINFAVPWKGQANNSSDYFSACSSTMNVPYYYGTNSPYLAFLTAKHGSAYAGIYSYQLGNYREYLECKYNISFLSIT